MLNRLGFDTLIVPCIIWRICHMDFRVFFLSLSEDERHAYAKRAGTTYNHIYKKLVQNRHIPRRKLFRALAEASQGQVSLIDLNEFFYGSPNKKAA